MKKKLFERVLNEGVAYPCTTVRMRALAREDKFIADLMKKARTRREVLSIYNSYIVEDSAMSDAYNHVKPSTEDWGDEEWKEAMQIVEGVFKRKAVDKIIDIVAENMKNDECPEEVKEVYKRTKVRDALVKAIVELSKRKWGINTRISEELYTFKHIEFNVYWGVHITVTLEGWGMSTGIFADDRDLPYVEIMADGVGECK